MMVIPPCINSSIPPKMNGAEPLYLEVESRLILSATAKLLA
jgi:hypothetical protein